LRSTGGSFDGSFAPPSIPLASVGHFEAEPVANSSTFRQVRPLEMPSSSVPLQSDAHGKALSLNLDDAIYGTLAEIGAGQEVAQWFFRVGAASGTVAKSISAYDKMVSDDIYGAGSRYVSKERLLAMLDYEYVSLLERLRSTRGQGTRFFVFADTVAVRNYQNTNEQHGWLGIRFQAEANSQPSQIVLHINLRDPTAELQQKAIGILGVNLVYAAFHQRSGIETFLDGLFGELSTSRLEIDVIELSGEAFAAEDERLWCLELLRHKMAHAIAFDAGGKIAEPSSRLRKRPLLVLRGSFSRPEYFDSRLFDAGRRQLAAEEEPSERGPAAILELTIHHVSHAEEFSLAGIMECVQKAAPLGSVLVTDYPETYKLSRYLRRHTTEAVRFLINVATAAKMLNEAFYLSLPGTLLEGLGKLLATNVKLYIAPMRADAFHAAIGNLPGIDVKNSGERLVTLDDLAPSAPTRYLWEYLRVSGRVVALATHGYD